jgi:hypothetical protein
MTPADLARQNALSFECKKDSLRQSQSGDWKIAFTVQGLDMDERLTKAFPGTRYMAVLVEIGADELPVHQPPQPTPYPPAAAKREKMYWREVQPASQCGIRCQDPVFLKFLLEEHGIEARNSDEAANAIRAWCKIKSRSELSTNHKARVLWHSLDEHFLAWKHVDA